MADKPNSPIRESRFGFSSPSLFLPRVGLFNDRLVLSGWQLSGRYRREILLRQILQVDAPSEGDLLLWLSVGETVRLRIHRAPTWKREIEAQVSRLTAQHV